ncbi:hypothetical protein V5799_032352 [Amblyomma americanum]|uniref:Uncharacterized protein n=1 Tax=Amblyomma americanum TaxID=6943 RepID=A0AAQ4DRE7_AMBAM
MDSPKSTRTAKIAHQNKRPRLDIDSAPSQQALKQQVAKVLNRQERLFMFLSSDVNKAYCAFLLSVIPEFEKTNTFLQSGAPQVHVLLEVLNSLLREILLRFVKPSVIKSSCELTDIDYKSSGNQRDDDDLVIGSQTLQILERLKIADKQQFLTRVRRFFVVVSDYIILKFLLKSEILKKAEVARLSSIVTA